MLKCLNCNNIIPDDSEFCQYCGNKVIVTEKSKKAEIFKNTLSIKKNHNVSSFFNIITLLSIIISIALLTENTQLKKELQTTKTSLENLRTSFSGLSQKYQDKAEEFEEIQEKLYNYETAVVFVNERYKFYVDGRYHYITCPKVRLSGASSYASIDNISSSGLFKICECELQYEYDFARSKDIIKNKLP